ncbi:histidine N-alpha-methyltransferase-like [Pecten maximus]|uniref:histidine N-alpha-methyltransferase-like n=1 Tax=Pecten maximus TaxID=6579 RepID=UPI0014584422|nr:histidine N-alpha-methyltransferase-like [Pecten maximus]
MTGKKLIARQIVIEQDIIPRVPYDFTLVDLGSGDCSKTRYVIDELLKRQQNLSFFPVDISREFLLNSTKKLREEYADSLVVTPIGADYQQGVEQLKQFKGPKLILWIGSMINLPYDVQVDTLRMIFTIMTDKCRLVFTGDITQDRDAILKAYHDDEGLAQCFIEYAITRLNKEEGSQIDLGKFTYQMDFISDQNPNHMSYVTAYLEAKEAVNYPIPGLGIDLIMTKGERLYFHEGVGFSCKYTLKQLQNIAQKAGLILTNTWSDGQKHAAFCCCTTV